MAGETGESIYRTWQSIDATSTLGYTLNYGWSADTPHLQAEATSRKTPSGIHPRLYFKYVKGKMSTLEFASFKKRTDKLESLVDDFTKSGQQAMAEQSIKQFIIISKESAAYVCGYTKFLTQEHVDKYKYNIKGSTLKVTPLKNFCRVIPKAVMKKVNNCMEKGLFDDYVIFHLDNAGSKETEKERIERERDPIIFGKIEFSDRYYFIADWEDELDDLRFNDIVTNLVLKGKDITMDRKPKLSLGGNGQNET